MAVITNYTTLKTAMSDTMARGDLTSFLDNFIQLFEESFYRDPLNWGSWMETAFSANIAAGVVAVPTDFLAWKVAGIGSIKNKLQPVPLSQLYGRYPREGDTGYPKWIARNGANFEFGPIPDSTYAVAGTYFAKQTVIRTDSDGINFLTTNAPDLLLAGSLVHGYMFIKDETRAAAWQQIADMAIASYRKFIKSTDLSGGPLQVQLG